MLCKNCHTELPDNTEVCSSCGQKQGDVQAPKKEARKDFTHYKIILHNPGPRESVISLLEEITSLNDKKVRQHLENLPWVIANKIPYDRAQEIKLLLEMNKAQVQVDGVDLWEEEGISVAADDGESDDKRKIGWYRSLTGLAVLIIIAVSIYLLITILGSGQSGGFLQKMSQSPGTSNPISGGESADGSTTAPGGTQQISEPAKILLADQNFTFSSRGYSPFENEIIFDLSILSRTDIEIHVFDINFTYVTRLIKRSLEPDNYRLRWFGDSDSGTKVKSGLYILQIKETENIFFYKTVWLHSQTQ